MRLPKMHYCRIKGKAGFCVYWSRDGKQKRLQVPIEDEDTLKKWVESEQKALWLEVLGHSPKPQPGKATLREVIDTYFKEEMYYPNKAEKTIKGYKENLNRLTDRFGERAPISSITSDAVALWKRDRLGVASRVTVNNNLRVMRTLLGFAKRRGLIEDIPQFSLPKCRTHREEIIPKDHVLSLVRGLDLDDPNQRGFYMVLFTGLRGTDIEHLGPQSFDHASKSIVLTTHKTGQKLILPLPSTLWDRLEKYMGEEPFCLYPTWQRSIYFTKRLCGVSYGARICRPTFASGLAEAGVDFMTIKYILGHKPADITAGYITRNLEQVRGQMALLPWLDANKFYPVVITGGA